MDYVIQTIVDVLSLGGLYALLALGLGVVFSIMNLVNWAHGELIVVGGYTMYLLAGFPLPVVILGTVITVTVTALLMERAAFRPIRGAAPSTLMFTSFALSYLLQNAALIAFGSFPKSIPGMSGLISQVKIGSVELPLVNIITILVTICVLVVLVLFLKRSSLGLQMRASAEDFVTSRLLGVKANRVVVASFAISGLLAGVVALLFLGQQGVVRPTTGLEPLTIAFVAVVLGGMGNLSGAVLGGFVVGALQTGFQVLLPVAYGQYRSAFVFFLVIVFLLFRPQGLLPPRTAARRV